MTTAKHHAHHSHRGAVGDSLRAKRRKKTRRALLSYVMAFGVIYAGAWHVAHHPRFAVEGFEVEGNAASSDEAVEAAARAALASPALSVLPMTNAYLARTGRIEEAVEAALPEVASATVERDGLELVVKVAERERFGYWCPSTSSGQAPAGSAQGGGCYALDPDGMIFAREEPLQGATRFQGLVTAADPIRSRYVPDKTWANVSTIVASLRNHGLTPTRVSSADGVDFRIELAEGPYLLADANQPGAQAVENLEIALDDESLAAVRGYAYADLRLPRKVFLRPLGGEATPAPKVAE